MSFTFRVIFNGVLAYVPDKPFFEKCQKAEEVHKEEGICHTCDGYECCTIEEGRKPVCYKCDKKEGCWEKRDALDPVRSLAVLVPDLRRSGFPMTHDKIPTRSKKKHKKGHGLGLPRIREPHFPLLRFRLTDLRERTTRRVDLVCRDIAGQDEDGVLFLRREQIRFKMEAENAKTFSFADWTPCPPPRCDDLPDCCRKLGKLPEWWGRSPDLADRDQLESLWWLPDLERIVLDPLCQDAIQVKRDVLPSYRGPFPEGLIARIESHGGRLRTHDFNRDVDGVPVRWSFVPSNDLANEKASTWNRALANSLALEFFDVRDEVRIELKRLANEVIVEELVLAPAPGAARPVLEIEISNREPDLLFQQESFNRSALPDMDFQPFYELLSNAKREYISRLPIPFPGRQSFFGVVEKPCAGTGMKG